MIATFAPAIFLVLSYLLTVPAYADPPAGLYFIHVDHLNTPRAIYNDQQQLVWRWDQAEPFGDSSPNENPIGLGTFECNTRFPGQYFDKETNLGYNYFRDFDPSLGRYVQSDPIGIAGGLNTFSYAYSNPTSLYDPDGLCVCDLASCMGKCIKSYGGDYAFIALGLGSPFASVPYPGNKQLLGSANRYTSLFSIATRSLGFSGIARVARSLNPIANVASAGAAGYLSGLSANCGVRCAVDCDQ
jgi:RHS repeat-associated protein